MIVVHAGHFPQMTDVIHDDQVLQSQEKCVTHCLPIDRHTRRFEANRLDIIYNRIARAFVLSHHTSPRNIRFDQNPALSVDKQCTLSEIVLGE